jgi:coenzyme Q-binding protein COQ10
MAQASRSIQIKASPKDCFKVITDYESYPEFLKETKEVKVAKRSGNSCEVTYVLDLVKTITYSLKMKECPPDRIEWSFIKGDIIKDNSGEWLLEETDKGVTQATYTIDINLGLFVPSSISKMLIGQSLPAMLEAFKKRIEGLKKGKK